MSKRVAKKFEREDWNVFIFQYMRHALIREVFNSEKGLAYTGEFLQFMRKNEEKWQDDADGDLF